MKIRGASDHTKLFAPIFIGLAFGLAIVGSFPIFVPSKLAVSNAMSTEVTFEDCIKMPGSYMMESYPPICVSSQGKSYVKKSPRVIVNPQIYQP